jgi:hypothetical protein
MKKILAILLGVALVAGALSLTSCQKNVDNAKSLINTVWGAQDGADQYFLEFTSQMGCKMRINDRSPYEGTFIILGNKPSLKGSSIEVVFTDWAEKVEALVGEFKSEDELDLDHMMFYRLPVDAK